MVLILSMNNCSKPTTHKNFNSMTIFVVNFLFWMKKTLENLDNYYKYKVLKTFFVTTDKIFLKCS